MATHPHRARCSSCLPWEAAVCMVRLMLLCAWCDAALPSCLTWGAAVSMVRWCCVCIVRLVLYAWCDAAHHPACHGERPCAWCVWWCVFMVRVVLDCACDACCPGMQLCVVHVLLCAWCILLAAWKGRMVPCVGFRACFFCIQAAETPVLPAAENASGSDFCRITKANIMRYGRIVLGSNAGS